MEVLKDSRQIPKREEYTANKSYSDIVYTWLQVNSEYDKKSKIRWIAKKDVKFTVMAEELGLTRQTVSTKFKKLLPANEDNKAGIGLITYNDELKRYELVELDKNAAMLVEQTTLRVMLSSLNENAISVYVYFLNRYLANQSQSYEFTLDQVKAFIGLRVGIRTNNYIITDIIQVLQKLGLLEYKYVLQEDRSHYTIIRVTNHITW